MRQLEMHCIVRVAPLFANQIDSHQFVENVTITIDCIARFDPETFLTRAPALAKHTHTFHTYNCECALYVYSILEPFIYDART